MCAASSSTGVGESLIEASGICDCSACSGDGAVTSSLATGVGEVTTVLQLGNRGRDQ